MVAIVIFFLILCPILAIIPIFYLIYTKRVSGFFFLTIFMASLSMCYPPAGDQYRYWLEFQNQKFGVEEFFYLPARHAESLIGAILVLFAKLNFPYEYVRFFFVLCAYSILFWIFVNMIRCAEVEKKISPKKHFFLFIIFYTATLYPFLYICYGFRYGLGGVFLLWAVYSFSQKDYIKGSCGACLAIYSHIAYLSVVLLLFAIPFFSKMVRKHKILIFLLPVLTLCFLPGIEAGLSLLLAYLPEPLQVLAFYTEESSPLKTGTFDGRSGLNIFLNLSAVYMYAVYACVLIDRYRLFISTPERKSFSLNYIFGYLFLLILFYFMFLRYYVFAERITFIIFIFSVLMVIYSALHVNIHWPSRQRLRNYFVFFLLWLLFFYVMNVRKTWSVASFKTVLTPLGIVWPYSYDQAWCEHFLDEDNGNLRYGEI